MTFEYNDLVVNLKKVDDLPLKTSLIIEYAGVLELHPYAPQIPELKGEGYLMRYIGASISIYEDEKFSVPSMKFFWILEKDLKGRFFLKRNLTPELETAILREGRIDEILED
jgi:hypothetical protein